MEQAEFRLGEMLDEAKSKLGSWDAVVDLLLEINGGKKHNLHSKKLPKIARGDPDAKLSIDELRLLDRLLRQFRGVGLAEVPLFRRGSEFFSQFHTHKTNLLISTRYLGHRRTDTASAWDVKAAAWLMSRGEGEQAMYPVHQWKKTTLSKALSEQSRWLRCFSEPENIISIGSPLGSISSEHMLGEMFGVKPFKARPVPDSPVYFVIPGREERMFNSSFVVDLSRHKVDLPVAATKLEMHERAYVIGDEVFLCPEIGENFSCIIARRSDKNPQCIWATLAGLFAPTTFGAAHAISQRLVPYELLIDPGARDSVFVAMIKMTIERWDKVQTGRDNRKVLYPTVRVLPDKLFLFSKSKAGEWIRQTVE